MTTPFPEALLSELSKIFRNISSYEKSTSTNYYPRASNQPFCPRYHYYCKNTALGLGKPKWHSTSSGMAYMAIGSGIHQTIQELVSVQKSSLKLVGYWKCSNPKCGAVINNRIMGIDEAKKLRPCSCFNHLKYEEVAFEDPVIRMSGHADGILVMDYMDQKIVILLELKTTDTTKLDNYNKPFSTHILQAHQYIGMMRDSGLKINHILVLYVGREPVRNGNFLKMRLFLGTADENLILIQKWLIETANHSVINNFEPLGLCKGPDDSKKFDQVCVFQTHCFRNGSPFPSDAQTASAVSYYLTPRVPFITSLILKSIDSNEKPVNDDIEF